MQSNAIDIVDVLWEILWAYKRYKLENGNKDFSFRNPYPGFESYKTPQSAVCGAPWEIL